MLVPVSALVILSLPIFAFPSRRSNTTSVTAANSTLTWTPCPDTPNDARNTTFYCSSLKVPLNWLNPKDGVEADLFMRMYPGDQGVDKIGSLLINPGGPGGSSSQWVVDKGSILSSFVGGMFDIVGVDPRGANLSHPNVRAHVSDYQADLYNLANPSFVLSHDPTVPFNTSSDPAAYKADLASFDAMDRVTGLKAALVQQRTTVEERTSISTAFAARDLAAVVDALGEADGLIHYYGFSYGTVLGATFAAMFPEKVGRMILDGVVDSDYYYNDWQKLLEIEVVAFEEVSAEFGRLCALAGPSGCELASNDTSLSAEDGARFVESQVKAVIHQLYENPLPVLEDEAGFSSFVTGLDAYNLYGSVLYAPASWPIVATAFSLALAGNGSVIRALLPMSQNLVRGDRSHAIDNVFNRTTSRSDGREITQQITCIDQAASAWEKNGLRNGSNEGWVSYAEEVRKKGWGTSESLLNLLHGCRSFNEPALERYAGPFNVKDGLGKLKNPILFVGNTHDPITPLVSAQRMAQAFGEENASLLVHDARGHTTLVEPSACTVAALQEYLFNGTLPTYGTTCQADEQLVFAPAAQTLEAKTASDSSGVSSTDSSSGITALEEGGAVGASVIGLGAVGVVLRRWTRTKAVVAGGRAGGNYIALSNPRSL